MKPISPFSDVPEAQLSTTAVGEARVQRANRSQVLLQPTDLDGLLPPDHRARIVWAFVMGLDLGSLYGEIGATEGHAGRPPIDPAILMALWLYATIDGVGSARQLDRLCESHDAYRWICGGVSVNYHTLSDFRVNHEEMLDRQLTESVAALLAGGLVTLERVAQDGLKVRASAGTGSFRRKATLKRCLAEAEEQVQQLKKELNEDPANSSRRQRAARERAAKERAERVERALAQMPEIEARWKNARTGKRAVVAPDAKSGVPRASSTDPDARVMKMGDGGYRPAFNGQFATDTASQVIVGVDATNAGSDYGQLLPMHQQLWRRFGRIPTEILVDSGYAKLDDIEQVGNRGTTVYAPAVAPRSNRDPHLPLPRDPIRVAEWRVRMGTPEAKAVYRERGAVAECVNALARGRGLVRMPVRGVRKARVIMLWYALAHNALRAHTLRNAKSP